MAQGVRGWTRPVDDAEFLRMTAVVEAARALLAECDDLEGEYDAVGIGTIRHFLAARVRAHTDTTTEKET